MHFSKHSIRKPSETGTGSKLISSPRLSDTHPHANTFLADNFSHCSQTPNGKESWGLRYDFRHSLQRTQLKDALEDVAGRGVLCLNARLFEHTQVRSHPDVIPVLLTLK